MANIKESATHPRNLKVFEFIFRDNIKRVFINIRNIMHTCQIIFDKIVRLMIRK